MTIIYFSHWNHICSLIMFRNKTINPWDFAMSSWIKWKHHSDSECMTTSLFIALVPWPNREQCKKSNYSHNSPLSFSIAPSSPPVNKHKICKYSSNYKVMVNFNEFPQWKEEHPFILQRCIALFCQKYCNANALMRSCQRGAGEVKTLLMWCHVTFERCSVAQPDNLNDLLEDPQSHRVLIMGCRTSSAARSSFPNWGEASISERDSFLKL